MKHLFLSCLTLLMGLTANAQTASLRLDSLNLYGNRLSMMTQHLVLSAANSTRTSHVVRWMVEAKETLTGQSFLCADTTMSLSERPFHDILLSIRMPQGNYQLDVYMNKLGGEPLGSTTVTIAPLRKLHFEATLSLDMLTTESDANYLFGDELRGFVRVKNLDAPYYGVGTGKAIELWLEDAETRECLFALHMADELDWGGQTERHYSHDLPVAASGRYTLKVGYASPDGIIAIDSICFSRRQHTCTYWTPDARVHVLPFGSHGQIVVPAEAVAADLRGIARLETAVSLDVTQANPNCLYYLDAEDPLPDGLSADACNVVRDLQSTSIRINEDYNFFCPLAFIAQFVSYLLKPTYEDTHGSGYSETLVLPFRPDAALLYDLNGHTEPLHADMLKILRYYGYDDDTLTIAAISSVRQMEAYQPYILGVYVGSRLLFEAENATMAMTGEAISRGGVFNLVGTTVAQTLTTPTYQYMAGKNGFLLRADGLQLQPFRACIVAADAISPTNPEVGCTFLPFGNYVWGPNGNPQPEEQTVVESLQHQQPAVTSSPVYSLSGQRIGNRQAFPRGLYIVGGKKAVVK